MSLLCAGADGDGSEGVAVHHEVHTLSAIPVADDAPAAVVLVGWYLAIRSGQVDCDGEGVGGAAAVPTGDCRSDGVDGRGDETSWH